MAGESPDRSKQRESSVEPTSGKGGPVPEARDPRLAVSRKSEKRGGVDTATRVLSTRNLTPDAEDSAEDAAADDAEGSAPQDDTRLREAVAAWVRSGDSAGEEKATGDAPEAENAADDATEEPEDATGAADRPEDATGEADEPEDAVPAPAEPKAADQRADAEPEDASADTEKPEDASEPQYATGDTDEPEDAVPAPAEPKAADQRADAEPEDASADAEKPEDASEPQDATGDTDEPEDAVPAPAEPKAADQHADAEPEDASADAEKPEDASEPQDAVPATDDEPTDAVPAKDGNEPEDAVPAKDGDEPEDAVPAKDDDEPEDSAPEDTPEPQDAVPDLDSPEDADQRADAGDAERKAETASGPETDAEPAPGPARDTGTKADAKPGAAAAADATAKPKADAKADATPERPATDRDSGPDASPAADDESRTDGAGGDEKAEDDAKAVDQPTAVFKAPKPKPRVDQPTTMLKLGGKSTAPGTPVPEAERTSKFVALKPLDDPSTRKPAAKSGAGAAPADATTPVPQLGPERTTQQPLPPKPPLDLLAELTNTPPPPETPVRTIVRRVKIWTPLVLLLAVVFAVVQAVRPLPAPTLALTAEDTYQFKGDKLALPWPTEGQGWMDVNGVGTMGTFGKQTPVAIGSVAKTMTAYIILKEHPLKPGAEGPSITVDATAEKEGGYNKAGESTLDTVKKNDKLTEKQALSAVMIPSANNIARLLARWDAGSEAAFVKKMNATAKKLGMTHTTYTDPSGLKETTVSTAEDQVKLGNKVVQIPALTAITSAASWDDPTGKNWPNPNTLPYVMGAIGIKTGSTTAAGGNLLFAARKEVGGETVTVVGAILGQHKPDILATVNAVSKTALVAAKGALTSEKILEKGDVVGYVDDGLGGHTPIAVTQDVTAVGWAGLKAKLSFDAGAVPHTAKAGTKVGTLTVGDGKSGAVKVPVALQKQLGEPGLGSKLTRLG
ncbi:D-alanyl-D-alanine carboxypeptidase [Streptomyces sp. NPDC001348]